MNLNINVAVSYFEYLSPFLTALHILLGDWGKHKIVCSFAIEFTSNEQ